MVAVGKGNGVCGVGVSGSTSTRLSLNSAHSCAGTTEKERVFSRPDRARVGMRTHRCRNCFLMPSPSNCRVTRGSLRFRGGRSPAMCACEVGFGPSEKGKTKKTKSCVETRPKSKRKNLECAFHHFRETDRAYVFRATPLGLKLSAKRHTLIRVIAFPTARFSSRKP